MSLNGVDQIGNALDALQRGNARTFLRIWASIPSGDRHAMLAHLSPLVYDLIISGYEDAVTLGLEQVDWQRARVPLPTATAPNPQRAQVDESLRFLLTARGVDRLRESVWGMVDKHIRSGHRDTVMLSAFAAGNGYARQPELGACDFCLMLASRGAAYLTRSAAQSVGAPGVVMRGNRKAGDSYHDNCKCRAVEVSEGTGLPPQALTLRKRWIETFYPGGERLLESTDFESTNPLWRKALQDLELPG